MTKRGILIGRRVPKDFFITKGTGQSDITVHAGSYHLALKKAGIEMCNIMTYSSIMPEISKQIRKPKDFTHGEVLESIMAVAHAEKGQRATAGMIFGWLYDKKTRKKFGGLVCEHNGDYSVEEIKEKLKASINELYENGFSEKYNLKKVKILTESLVPKKNYGTALVGICFVNYVVPVLD
ncbi:MAG: pyruvoyl-dependent arginine decarboxylase [Candidatus Pacearchaeota archaeon]